MRYDFFFSYDKKNMLDLRRTFLDVPHECDRLENNHFQTGFCFDFVHAIIY